MIRLSRKTEYALLALSYLRGRVEEPVASVKDIAGHYHIPQALLAKVMQLLKRNELVRSVKGMSGGYALAGDLRTVTFLQFLAVFDEDTDLVDCLATKKPACLQLDGCAIRDPIASLNAVLRAHLSALTLDDLYSMGSGRPITSLLARPPVSTLA